MGTSSLPHPITAAAFGSPVAPGTGWPGDPADADTPVGVRERQVATLAAAAADLGEVDARSSVCEACPRLVSWREEVAVTKRRAFADQPYWGRPAPGFGDEQPRLLIVGLAPAAHGANRTGRVFTGDRSGDWLFAALHRTGFANQATSVHAGDGLVLTGARIVAAVRCAPPDNKPTPEERRTCAHWLRREITLVTPSTTAILALGGIAWQATFAALAELGWAVPRPRPGFGHGAEAAVVTPEGRRVLLIGSYHVSQQNTFTGRLTEEMLDDVLLRARAVR
ncbi:uracil-DNA glycosylase [Pseudactinotalea terrae]|uniref:uracil-DNA glycosylase n=1 Tax=Pseudactinotalea terrae TaxID=1743262 RepID=UPI0012E148DE|nr:uracil-DNA glycosylase [Pseudactinotalea terrae]